MIDSAIQELAENFVKRFQSISAQIPELQLDGTWPSIGVLDLILMHLKGATEYTESDEALIFGAAAYLGTVAHSIWKKFDSGLTVILKGVSEPEFDIVLMAQNGRFLEENEPFSIALGSSLKEILREPHDPFPVFESFLRNVPPEYPHISLFAFGVCCGLSPFGEGGWRNYNIADFEAYLDSCLQSASTSAAVHYENVHPNAPAGANPNLYASILLPPLLYNEPVLGLRPATEFLNFFSGSSYTREQTLAVALDFAKSADEVLSTTGAIVSVALSNSIDRTFRLLMETKESYAYSFRPAIMAIRNAANRPADWIQAAQYDLQDEMELFAEIEFQYSLLPLCYFPPSYLLRHTFTTKLVSGSDESNFLQALAFSHAPTARTAGESLAERYSGNFYLLAQLCFLDLIADDLPRFEQRIVELKDSNGLQPSLFHELVARYAIRCEDNAYALEHAQKALNQPMENGLRSGIIFDLLALCARLTGDGALARSTVERAMSRNEFTLKTLHTHLELQYLGNELEDVRRTMNYLKRVAPCDPKLLRYMTWTTEVK